jgi:endonuclease/exonuclease/phosphatase family metal-dependent hydrolase
MIVSFARDGNEIGQHPEESVPQLLATGELLPTDHYWHEGMKEWAVVSDRWPAKKKPTAPSRSVAVVLKAPAPVREKGSSVWWLIILGALMCAGAYFYLAEPNTPVPTATPVVATPTPAATPEATSTPTPTPQEENPAPTPTPEPSPVAAGKTISVISWNLEWYPGRKPKASPEEQEKHKQAAKAELRKLNPDIFMSQEIATWDDFIDLCSVVPGLDVAIVSHYLQGNGVARQQTTVASKLPVVAAWYDNWKQAATQPPRGYASAVVQIPGTDKLLLFYSVHLKSNGGRSEEDTQENYARREESARQLLAHVKLMEDEAFKGRIAGVVVGGDFNTNHDGQFEDKTVQMLIDAGFVNTWEGVPREQRHTWIGSDRYDPTTFDYIMTKGLGSLKAELIEVPEAASDHRPVKLEVSLPAE